MIKRIRDFIYDINDIFVAIVIILIAAGIIVWRSTAILGYQDYVAAKNPDSGGSIVFDPDDLIKDPVDPVIPDDPQNPDPENPETEDPGTEDPGTENPGTEDPETPGQNTPENPDTPTPDKPAVSASITIEQGIKGWKVVGERLAAAGIIGADEVNAFVAKVNELNLATRLQIGTFTVSSDMDYEQMIKVLCRIK